MSYHFHPDAEQEHLAVVVFYESKRVGLGALYLAEFEVMMARIVDNPQRYRVERLPDVRVVSMLKFPYRVVYRVVADKVQILALAHKRRSPNYWQERVNN